MQILVANISKKLNIFYFYCFLEPYKKNNIIFKDLSATKYLI